MLPLTAENVACVFKTGVLTKGDYEPFGQRLGIPPDLFSDPLGAAAWWVGQGRDNTWRVIIYFLDVFGKTGIADELMPYSEPSGV